MGYDAIIIGSGLGGCAAGAALAGAGKKVLVLERMDVVGGRCSTTKDRDGFRMDIGVHYLAGGKHAAFEEAAKRVGKGGILKFASPPNISFKVEDTRVIISNKDLIVKNEAGKRIVIHISDAVKQISNKMPARLMKVVMNMISRLLPLITKVAGPKIGRQDKKTIADALERYIEWPALQDGMELLQMAAWGTPSYMTPMSELWRSMLVLLDYYKPGMNLLEILGYPVGGLGTVPETICEGIKENGGEVRLNTNVKRVIVEDGKAAGVELDNGEVIRAPLVISNAGVKETVADLVGSDKFESSYAKRIGNLISGTACYTIRAALDSKITDLSGLFCVPESNMVDYCRKMWNDGVIPDSLPSIMWTVPSNVDPTAAPEGKQLVMIVSPLAFDLKEPYSKIEPLVLQAMESVLPGFNDHLMWYDCLTPESYLALGEKGAPAIGLAQCVGQVGKERPSSKSPIEGLYYVGAECGTDMSGVGTEMATRSGLKVADYILQEEGMKEKHMSGHRRILMKFKSSI